MLRKIVSLLTVLVLTICPIIFEQDARAEMPYYITVDLTNQIVTVYNSSDGSIARQMLCSSGVNDSTPEGTYTLPKKRRQSERQEWYYFHTFQCYAKYATRIYNGILFHSIPYSAQRESTIDKKGVAKLGMPASHGCIRMRKEDCQFIAENCLEGTQVRIYKSDEFDSELRELLLESSYTSENGLSYNDFLGIPEDPDTLGRFSTGQAVEDLQYRLRALGFFSDEISGCYRTSTINAIKQVQKELGLNQNGYTSPELMEIIFSQDAPTAMNVELSEGMSGPIVRSLQNSLETLRLYDGDIDGIYDVDVINSVKVFQQVYGYSVDGIASPEVQKAIYYEAGKLSALFVGSDYTCEQSVETIPMAVVSSSVRVRVRAKPNTNSEALDKVTDGTQMMLLEKGDPWSKIQYGSTVGYMKNVFLNFIDWNMITLRYTQVGGDHTYIIGNTLDEYRSGAPYPAEVFANYLASEGSLEDYEGIGEFATVNTGTEGAKLNLRANPNSSAEILAELENGTRVKVLLKSAEWTLVEYESATGYLMNDYIEFWSGPEDALDDGSHSDAADNSIEVSIPALVRAPGGGNADVFDIDSEDANKIGYLPHNTPVTVVQADDDWSYIDYQGHRGYMRNENLQFQMADELV